MTKPQILGWLKVWYMKQTHHYKKRPDMNIAISACWIISDANKLEKDDTLPHCQACEKALADGLISLFITEKV